MWKMLQQDSGDTYVIATGESHSAGEFVEEAGHIYKLDIEWVSNIFPTALFWSVFKEVW